MMKNATKTILISAGELSGEMHAVNLIQEVQKIIPQAKFYGMGSSLMKQSGVDILVDTKELSIIGALEIITKFKKIWRALKTMQKAIKNDKPNLLILIDYPEFNLRLAKAAKKAGVKVLYFISPKIWAWRQGRIKKIQKYVDLMAVIFPFEVNFYQKFNVPVKFVGNPLLKMIQNRLPVEEAKKLFNLKSEYQTIGLFPGSRSSEIKRLLPIMLETAELLSAKNSKLQFILSQASSITDQELAQHLATSNLSIKVVSGHNYNVMQVCDAIISASGTATLEIALLAIPLVIIYKISWWEYEIAKRLIKIPYVGLCNILAQKLVVPELLQNDATPEKIAQAIETIIQNQGYEQQMVIELKKIRQIFEETEKTEIAVLVKNLLESTS